MSTDQALPKPVVASSREGMARIARLLDRSQASRELGIDEAVRPILERVRQGGDQELLELRAELDGAGPEVGIVWETPADLQIPSSVAAALRESMASVRTFHQAVMKHGRLAETLVLERDGVQLEERHEPLTRVGLYVPGGRFPYPSSVIMSAIPALVAGVEEVVVVTPPQALASSETLQWTLKEAGVQEVWAVGGAQAIAALAYGTETLRPVDFIAGPGNAWVSAAKKQVASVVGVDRDAGPSEVVVVASKGAPAEWVAADLLAQAEHDPLAMAVLVTEDVGLAGLVAEELGRQSQQLSSPAVALEALSNLGAILVVGSVNEAVELATRLAPEHLQLIGESAEANAAAVRNAGAVFIGAGTPTAFGDYVAGPSHVLPTGRSARYSSGLSVNDFVRRCHSVSSSNQASQRLGQSARILAETEGLEAHARSAGLRCGETRDV